MRTVFYLGLLVVYGATTFAQGTTSGEKATVKWQTLNNKNEIAVSMPEGARGFTEDNDFYLGRPPGNHVTKRVLLSFHANGAVLITEVYEGDVRDIRNALVERLGEGKSGYELVKQQDIGDVSLVSYRRNKERLFSTQQFVLFKKRLYVFQGHAGSESNLVYNRYFKSLSLIAGDKAIMPNLLPGDDPQAAAAPSDLLVETAPLDGTVYEGKPDREVMILYKPRPRYPSDARQTGASGQVNLRILFSASGKISKIEAESGVRALQESARAAAEQILFIPAEKDGKLVSTWKKVSYSFSIY